ncbi:hypothetical protein CLF_103119 [Clonorchis sinensis]|uniref:Uncharacterized protein n=1 Tax=Clonorchis sinensis TaxID=79923 RepID=G7Y945_CLOSI|nr:hypothetical protein CLF_103119 [Clonorchis sinensis]
MAMDTGTNHPLIIETPMLSVNPFKFVVLHHLPSVPHGKLSLHPRNLLEYLPTAKFGVAGGEVLHSRFSQSEHFRGQVGLHISEFGSSEGFPHRDRDGSCRSQPYSARLSVVLTAAQRMRLFSTHWRFSKSPPNGSISSAIQVCGSSARSRSPVQRALAKSVRLYIKLYSLSSVYRKPERLLMETNWIFIPVSVCGRIPTETELVGFRTVPNTRHPSTLIDCQICTNGEAQKLTCKRSYTTQWKKSTQAIRVHSPYLCSAGWAAISAMTQATIQTITDLVGKRELCMIDTVAMVSLKQKRKEAGCKPGPIEISATQLLVGQDVKHTILGDSHRNSKSVADKLCKLMTKYAVVRPKGGPRTAVNERVAKGFRLVAIRRTACRRVNETPESVIIEEPNSIYNSMLIPVEKASGKYRFCLDLPHLNELTLAVLSVMVFCSL